jgi:polyphosphate kinase
VQSGAVVAGQGAVAANTPPLQSIKREHSIVEFNRRVLAQARRADVPLLERLRYITMVSSNMDEFFEVRFADVLETLRERGGSGPDRTVDAIATGATESPTKTDPSRPRASVRPSAWHGG